MRKILTMAALFWLVGCGDTIINNYGDPDKVAEDDMFAEDNTSYADNMVEPDKSVPLTDAEEWAYGCNPPFPDGTMIECGFKRVFYNPCPIEWNKKECTAKCDPPDGSWGFEDKTPKEVSESCVVYNPPKEDVVETDVEEWAPGCDPPWPDGTHLKCKLDEDFIVDFCVLSWDKSSCTASCWNPDTSSNVFWDCPAEALSTPYPNGAGCSLKY